MQMILLAQMKYEMCDDDEKKKNKKIEKLFIKSV